MARRERRHYFRYILEARRIRVPISSRADYESYLAADLRAHGLDRYRLWHHLSRPTLRFQRTLRYVEYVLNCRRSKAWRPYVLFQRLRLLRAGVRLGFEIPPNVFGPGLCIVHCGTITVSGLARVGSNCRIHPGTCLGQHEGGAPVLGDEVYIGPGAKLYGGIRLGNRVSVGANSVVNKSFGDSSIVAGVPAGIVGNTVPPA
jgi:serine O-acetyltransferase